MTQLTKTQTKLSTKQVEEIIASKIYAEDMTNDFRTLEERVENGYLCFDADVNIDIDVTTFPVSGPEVTGVKINKLTIEDVYFIDDDGDSVDYKVNTDNIEKKLYDYYR